MDQGSIQTASKYVNSLLLARGLLRDGRDIDFASLAKGSGQDTVTAEVVNLVHDLILRRDRESDNLSALSQSLQTVHANAAQQAQAVKTLEGQKAELQRELSAAKAQLRTAKLDSKSFESKNKAYKDDIQRLRTSVGQIRAQCANDVRKRDAEITRLKKHIDVSRTRETRSGMGPGGVTIIDPTTGKAFHPAATLRETPQPATGNTVGSSLREETNEHLTALSAELSENNEALTSLIQNTIATLRTLQGLPTDPAAGQVTAPNEQSDRSSSSFQAAAPMHEPVIQVAETPDVSKLTDDLTETISSLRTLLTEPSFVRYEEVEIRDAELARLRAGWETMEARWREAMSLMNGWRQRVSGDTTIQPISIDDIQRGMDLAEEGLSVAGSPDQRRYDHRDHRGRKRDSSGSEISQASIDTYNDGVSDVGDTSVISVGSEGDTGDLTLRVRQDPGPAPKLKKLRFESASKPPSKGPSIVPAPQILKPKNGNAKSPTRQVVQLAEPELEATPTPAVRAEPSAPSTARSDLTGPDVWLQSPVKSDDVAQSEQIGVESVAQRVHEPEAQGPAEVQEKDREAPKPVKRTVLPKRVASKRRSSLTPAEMQGLIGTR